MFCEKCGAMIEDGSSFCPQCGQKIEDSEQKKETNVETLLRGFF